MIIDTQIQIHIRRRIIYYVFLYIQNIIENIMINSL